jgi:polysaccharide biosynthesis/export protein VpsN
MTHWHRICRPILGLLGLSVVALFLTACGTAKPTSAQAFDPQKRISNKLRIGDVVSISFSGSDNVPVPLREERIKNDGKIVLPYIGAIQAADKTQRELEQDIIDAYIKGNYYKRLTVVVTAENRFFYVDGQVKNPNRYPHAGEMTVLRCIAAAGGFTDFAQKRKVQITRADGRKEEVNCNKAQSHPELDLPVFPDDRIWVPRRYM